MTRAFVSLAGMVKRLRFLLVPVVLSAGVSWFFGSLSKAQTPAPPVMSALYVTTVSQLPPAGGGWSGLIVFVSDATTSADCSTGGATSGAFLVACGSDGTSWAAMPVGH